jgi:hypothetical protein
VGGVLGLARTDYDNAKMDFQFIKMIDSHRVEEWHWTPPRAVANLVDELWTLLRPPHPSINPSQRPQISAFIVKVNGNCEKKDRGSLPLSYCRPESMV